MRDKSLLGALSVLVLISGLVIGGCSTARGNARVQPGWSGAISGFFSATPLHQATTADQKRTMMWPAVEADLQYAWKSSDGKGTALRLKVPLFYLATALDIYRQLSDGTDWSQGAGAELGLMPGAYYVVTRHSGPAYVSLTARAVFLSDSVFMIPQLTIGREGRFMPQAFLSYGHSLGKGTNIETENPSDHPDIRNQTLHGGLGLEF